MHTQRYGPQSPAAVSSAEGGKNLWVTPSVGCLALRICTYNARTLAGEQRLQEFIHQLENFNWDIIGLRDTRIKGKNYTILKSGHILFTVGRDDVNQHEVGFFNPQKSCGQHTRNPCILRENGPSHSANQQEIFTNTHTDLRTNNKVLRRGH